MTVALDVRQGGAVGAAAGVTVMSMQVEPLQVSARKAPWRVIASMSPGAVSLVAAGGGGRFGLSAGSEAAALCAGMDRHWMLAAMARLGDCDEAKAGLKAVLWSEASRMAVMERWRLLRGVPIMETLATLACDEFLLPARPDGLPARLPEIEKAVRLGCSERTWHRTWKPRYHHLAALPWAWLAEAESYIYRRQRP